MPARHLTEDQIAEVREIFSHYDTDGNGVIDVSEFGSLMDALDAELTEEQVKVGLEALDSNKNGTIEFDEFIVWWTDS